MAPRKTAVPQEIYQLKVTLLGTRPEIWRRLLVRSDITLEGLHTVLQSAMGWQDCHMHEFSVGDRRFGEPDPQDQSVGDERTVRLADILGSAGANGTYTYDFGDTWEHAIVLEQRLPVDEKAVYPVCTGGELACPPEDCGGLGGFYELLDAIGDPKHEQHEELREWVGENFDPHAFSVEEANRRLAPQRALRRKRSK
jgi:hypothetical protein